MLLKNSAFCRKIGPYGKRGGRKGWKRAEFPGRAAVSVKLTRHVRSLTGRHVPERMEGRGDALRVITGSARGRRLLEPEGLETRPTADRVKEGLFSAIQFEIEGRRVLDLFAGTGQMGIECLSRGAAEAVFVENRPRAAEIVRENLRRTGLAERGAVIAGDALEYLARARRRFGLIFLDPPYGTDLLEKALQGAAAFDILEAHGIIAAEHPAGRFPRLSPPAAEGLRLYRTYRYGKIAVTLLRKEGVLSRGEIAEK